VLVAVRAVATAEQAAHQRAEAERPAHEHAASERPALERAASERPALERAAAERPALERAGASDGLVGVGRVAWLEPEGERAAPAAYYLVGLVIDRAARRTGIGEALTRARTAWTLERSAEAWYFANAGNRASLDLHARGGFVEITRDFAVPGVSFEGGAGVLCRATAESVRTAHGASPSAPAPAPTPAGPSNVSSRS